MTFKLFSYRGVDLKCSPNIVVLIILAGIFDMWTTLLVAAVSLGLHEISHIITAKAFGIRADSIEIQPFGFVASFSFNMSRTEELAIAATGPIFSIITACVAAYVSNYIASNSLHILNEFIRFNVILGVINLFPALPLDGGRILRAFLDGFMPPAKALSFSLVPGIVLGVGLIALGVYAIACAHILNVTPLIMGFFLFLEAVRGFKNTNSKRFGTIIRRSDFMRRGRSVPMRYTAVHKSVLACDVLRMLNLNNYNIVVVVDEDMKKLGELDESMLISGMAGKGSMVSVGELLTDK